MEAASRRWMAAWMAQDRDALDAMLAPDYSLIIATMPTVRFGRDNWLQTAVGPYVCTRFDYAQVMMTRVADDLVIMSSTATVDASIDGVDRSGHFFLVDAWRRTPRGWQVCQRYSTRFGDVDDSDQKMADEAAR